MGEPSACLTPALNINTRRPSFMTHHDLRMDAPVQARCVDGFEVRAAPRNEHCHLGFWGELFWRLHLRGCRGCGGHRQALPAALLLPLLQMAGAAGGWTNDRCPEAAAVLRSCECRLAGSPSRRSAAAAAATEGKVARGACSCCCFGGSTTHAGIVHSQHCSMRLACRDCGGWSQE